MFVTSALLRREGFLHGFSTRRGGVSAAPFDSLNLGGSVGDDPAAVEENLRRLAAEAGFERGGFRAVLQVHGDRVVTADERPIPAGTEADALVSRTPGIAVAVKTADCVPILIASAATGSVAAVHAGWRGTDAAIVQRAVESLGLPPSELVAAVGPAIGACCYEVSEELAARFAARHGSASGVVRGRHLDLPAANRALLLEAGLRPEAIDVLDACTACDAERFFSHRRDRGNTGRHLSFVVARNGRPLS